MIPQKRHAVSKWLTRTTLLFAAAATFAVPYCRAQDCTSEADWAKRDAWQRPGEVMDALGIRAGSAVADVGAGRGYFTLRLAARVGAQGKVYAVDIDDSSLEKIRERAKKDGLTQVETVHSDAGDPKLPPDSVDAVLIVNSFHEMREYDAILQGLLRALKPGGVLGIIDSTAKPGSPRSRYYEQHDIPEELVREDAARNGFTFRRKEPGFKNGDGKNWYFLVFQKPVH